MGATALKDLLHLRIEQADEKLLAVLADLTESLFKSYQPEVLEEEMNQEEFDQLPMPEYKRLTVEESNAELKEAMDECDRGDFLTGEELEKEIATW